MKASMKIDSIPLGDLEQLLRKSEARPAPKDPSWDQAYFNQFFDGFPDALVLTDHSGRILRVNAEFLSLFGFRLDEALGQVIDILIVPPSAAEEAHGLTVRAARGECLSLEAVRRRKDGLLRNVVLHVLPIVVDGHTVAIFGVYRDVGLQKGAEEALRREISKFSGMIAGMDEGFSYADKDHRIIEVNAFFLSVIKKDKSEVIGRSIFDFHPAPVAEKIRAQIELFRQNPGSKPVSVQRALFGLEVILRLQPIYYRDEYDGLIFNIMDVTEMVQAKRNAQGGDRVKSEFLANISHEIRTPMNGILGMTELFGETPLSIEQKEYLKGIRSSAESLMTLIKDILDFSKMEAKKLELESVPFHLQDFLFNALAPLAIEAHKKKLELICDSPLSLPDLLIGDPGRLRQVLINLISNAVKFTSEGEIVIMVREEARTDNDVRLLFTISDTGIGIPKDKHLVIFSVFAQADGSMTRKYGGTGLGLAICSQLVSLMEGRIWVESEPKKGSKFHFTAKFGLSPMTSEKPEPVLSQDFKNAPVLLIEDNATTQRLLHDVLTQWRFSPVVTQSGEDALSLMEKAERGGQPFAAFIMDPYLPRMDSFVLQDRMKQNPKLAKSSIILLASASNQGDSAPWQKLGVQAFVTKPVRPSLLLTAVQSVLGLTPREASAQDDKAKPAAKSRAAGPRYRILIAEDNPVNQKVALFILEKQGHQVSAAKDGRDALEALERNIFDVILMDVQMPRMDGFEATAKIRAREKEAGGHMPIIAMTAHAMKGDRENCLEAGMDDYVSKPLQPEELMSTVERTVTRLRKSAKSPAPADADRK